MRFSFSFQQETPVSLQIEEAEEFGNDQEVSRDDGSVSEFFRPSRQRTSSSAEEEEHRKELIKRSHKSVMKIFFILICFFSRVFFFFLFPERKRS